ncbi:Uma2 family endonuclease [Singulisphaera rosea]
MATISSLMTVEEFLALPDDGVERELIRGELRESSMTTRGGPHCMVMTNLARVLSNWLCIQPLPRGRIFTGDMRVLLRRTPDSFVGADLAYISTELAAKTPINTTFIDGAPVLVVEIVSPSDTVEGIAEKVRGYLEAGVSLVWEVNPFYETILVHRPDARPELFNTEHGLTAEPHLPGFQTRVSEIFMV